jgi:hypothetical protein
MLAAASIYMFVLQINTAAATRIGQQLVTACTDIQIHVGLCRQEMCMNSSAHGSDHIISRVTPRAHSRDVSHKAWPIMHMPVQTCAPYTVP